MLYNIRSINKLYIENSNKIGNMIGALGDIRKTIIVIGSFRDKLLELQSTLTKTIKKI